MTKEQLRKIRGYLVNEIFRNGDLVFNNTVRGCDEKWDEKGPDLLGVIAALYNLLHEEVEGEGYDYFFHWANKVGGSVDDDYLDDIMNKED